MNGSAADRNRRVQAVALKRKRTRERLTNDKRPPIHDNYATADTAPWLCQGSGKRIYRQIRTVPVLLAHSASTDSSWLLRRQLARLSKGYVAP
jgi:hypothetical protein